MQLSLNLVRVKPSIEHKPLIEQIGLQEIKIEDVDYFTVTENEIRIMLNSGKYETVPLRSNDGNAQEDWRGLSMFITRKFLEVDLTK